MTLGSTLGLAAALIGAAGAFALAQGDARERLRHGVSDSCAAAAQVSAQHVATHLAACQSRALALLRMEERREDIVASDGDDALSDSATAMQGSPLMRMTPGERANALALRCLAFSAACGSR